MESLSMQKEPPQLPFSAHKKQVEKRMASVGEVGGNYIIIITCTKNMLVQVITCTVLFFIDVW